MQRITSTDLENWASTRDCQEHLSLFIRKLIRASPVKILNILFPAGDNVILPGYDGVLEVEDGTEYIPSGKSVWELGTGKHPRKKAKEDYKTRSEGLQNETFSEITFVFVTPRVWTGKDEWAKQKREKEKWKDVKVIDARVLEEWLEVLPSVSAWLAKFLSNRFANVQPIEEFWKEWSENLEHSISSILVVSGREAAVTELTKFIIDRPSLLTIKASTIEEAIAFVAACVERLGENDKEQVYARAIIVKNEQDFRSVISVKNPLIIIAQFEGSGIIDQAVKKGHHVIIPLNNDVSVATGPKIDLPRLRRTNFEKGLAEMGFDFDKTQQLIRNSGQSLSVLRRLLNFEKYQQPEWTKNGHHVEVIPALLAGMWSESKEQDKSLVSLLAGEPYEKYISKLSRWRVDKDPPVLQVASLWKITSVLDAWAVLARFLSKVDLDNFRTVFLAALNEIDPALELESDQRYMAPIYGKESKFSHSIKEGLCQSLILITVYGEQFALHATNLPQSFSDRLVHELLNEANGQKWCSLSNVLPLLAEASPSSFLSAVERSLSKFEPPVMEMFRGSNDGLFNSTNYYTGLLWALENLSYSTEHLLRVTLILGQLSRLDPGGNLVNRPINSLKEIFNPWYKQVEADFQTRQTVLDKLLLKEPGIAWKLFLSIAPQDHIVVHPIHKCRWRYDTGNLERSVTDQEGDDFDSFLFERLILLAKDNDKRVASLIDFYPNFNSKEREKLLQFLKEYRTSVDETDTVIWDELRELISRHKEHAEQRWALPNDELLKVEEVLTLYKPIDDKWKYLYLFEDGYITFPAGLKRKDLSFQERQKIVDDQRLSALKSVFERERLDGIFKMTNLLERPHHLARTTASLNLSEEEEKILLALLENEESTNLCCFAQEYILAKSALHGEQWILRAWQEVQSSYTDNEILARFFLALPQRKHSWDLLESLSPDVAKLYWQKMNPHLYSDRIEDNLYVLKALQKVNRHLTVLDKVTYLAENLSSEFLAEALINAATIPSNEDKRLHTYGIGQVFEILHTRNDLAEHQMAQLEGLYLSFLTASDTEKKPKQLFKELSNNPDFFIEVVSMIYLPDDSEKDNIYSKDDTLRYKKMETAMKLLESWREIPGVKKDGSIDQKKLTTWISEVRMKAKDCKMSDGADIEIGKLLACYPRNSNSWPPDEICEAIDTINSDIITSNFETEIFNSRGVSVRSPYEGGLQERNLAAYFEKMGKQIATKWPVTATALLNLAKHYANDAKIEDERAHLDELR